MGGTGEIAIVGMACVMPDAPDVEAFWANIVDGVDSVSEVPDSRWDQARHFDPDFDPSARDADREPMSVSKWGGFVPDVGFDALAWGIPPASLASIDPAQLMALKAAGGALEDAGYGPDGASFDRTRASVIYATGSGGAADLPAGFLLRLLLRTHGIYAHDLPPELDAFLPQLTEDGLPGVLTSVIAGRVANRLDLGGKNLTVDSACASVLVALDIAANELRGESSDMVLLGGVDLHNGPQDYVSFTAAGALARSGRCRAFDVGADGMTLAEGVGCVVLKRVDDAVRDGDRIYAVVRGVAGSSDGRHLGLTAPRQEGQVLAVERAYRAAGVSPTEIGLVEAHGTGTTTGDRTELATTTQVFQEAGVAPGSVVIGSVKSNIGHIKCASAMAALIKAAKCVYHGVMPPTLHIEQPIDVWDPETSPFSFLDEARPWLADRRLAGVSSFGFGGTNFHAILENFPPAEPPARPAGPSGPAEPRPPEPGVATAPAGVEPGSLPPPGPVSGRPHWPSELFAFRGSDAAVDQQLTDLATRLDEELAPAWQADRWRLRDVAAAVLAAGDATTPVRLAIVADDLHDLAAKVATARTGNSSDNGNPGGSAPGEPGDGIYRPRDLGMAGAGPKVAFLFPGAGEARPGMGAELFTTFPLLRTTVAPPPEWASAVWPRQAFGADDVAARDAAFAPVAGPAAGVVGLAAGLVLASFGVVPHHNLGELETPTGGLAPDGPADADGIRRLADAGVRIFVELGPGDGLTALVGEVLADVPHVAVATDRPGIHGLTSLLHAVAGLAVAGVGVDLAGLHAGRGSSPERWATPSRRPGWIINGHYARTASGDDLPKGLRPASQAPVFHIAGGEAPLAGVGADGNGHAGSPHGNGNGSSLSDGDLAVVTEYLKIIQGMITTGSEIIRGHVEAELR